MFPVQHAGFLALAIVLGLLMAGALHVCRRRSRRWRVAGIVLPGLSAVALALALAEPAVVRPGRVVVFLDFSPSARESPWHDPAWVQARAREHLAPGQRLTVVGFVGDRTKVLASNLTPADTWPVLFDWVPPSDTASIFFDGGLALGEEDDPARWVITDGVFAKFPPGSAQMAWTIVPPAAPDAAIRDLQVRGSGPGQVEILVQVRAAGVAPGAVARVTIRRDGVSIAEPVVDFPAGTTSRWISVADHVATEVPHRFTATVALPGDGWAENDGSAAIFPATTELRRLIVGAPPAPGEAGRFVPLAQFTATASQLAAEGWQVIVLNDVPAEADGAAALSPAAAHALDHFVRDNGGGLLILGGGHAFGPGRYGEGSVAGDVLEHLSPVASHSPKDNLAVLFLLDASSSMNAPAAANSAERKITLLSRALQDAAGCLAPEDSVTLVTFNAAAQRLATGPAQGLAPRLAGLLGAVEPAGTTNPDAALPELAAFMGSASRRLIILLTDGEIPSMDLAQWRAQIGAASTHLVIIAPPAPAGSPLAELAALPNVSWSQTENPAAWAAALRQALLAQSRGALETVPLAWRADELSGTAHQWTRTWLRPEATELATSTARDRPPVAALARRGLGQVAALTIADDNSAAYQGLWTRLVQAIAAAAGDRRFTVTTGRTGDGRWRIAADGSDAGRFLDQQKLWVRLFNDGEALPMAQTGPGHYEAFAPAGSEGLAGVIIHANAGTPPATAGTGDGEQLVARLQAPALETTEWPATVEPAAIPAAFTRLVPGQTVRWAPADVTDLSPFFWALGASAALAAVWVRK